MNYSSRRILFLDLEKEKFDIKSYEELHPFIGGVALGLRLAEIHYDYHPLIFAIGPLNGFYPFVTKTCIIDCKGSPEIVYIGGSLSHRLKFAGFDALVIHGKSLTPRFISINGKEVRFLSNPEEFKGAGLPGKCSRISFQDGVFLLDDHFSVPNNFLEEAFTRRGLAGLAVSSGVSVPLESFSRYEKLYRDILSREDTLNILPSNKPSCIGCSLGCESSATGETGGNILLRCLVACESASAIYSDLGIVFSCLDALGYDYSHEDIERIPGVVEDLLSSLEDLSRKEST